MSLGSVMLYKGCCTIFTVRKNELLYNIVIVLLIGTCGPVIRNCCSTTSIYFGTMFGLF